MPKTRLIMLACAVVFSASALGTSIASAATAGWMVNGALLSGEKIIKTTAAVDEAFKLTANLATENVTIECQGATVKNNEMAIASPNKGSAEFLEWTGCLAISLHNCAVTRNIKSLPLTFEATLDGTLAFKATLKPKVGENLATIKYEGEECPLFGVFPLRGKAMMLAPEGQDERTLQLIKILTETTTELKIGTNSATLVGAALYGLTTGERWSFL